MRQNTSFLSQECVDGGFGERMMIDTKSLARLGKIFVDMETNTQKWKRKYKVLLV